jgi:hypothetical protein
LNVAHILHSPFGFRPVPSKGASATPKRLERVLRGVSHLQSMMYINFKAICGRIL